MQVYFVGRIEIQVIGNCSILGGNLKGFKKRHFFLFPMAILCSFFGNCGEEEIELSFIKQGALLFLERGPLKDQQASVFKFSTEIELLANRETAFYSHKE